MTIDDALLWLNDRLGKSIHVCIAVHGHAVLAGYGEIAHWSESQTAERALAHDDHLGLYGVGETVLNLSDVQPHEVRMLHANRLMMRLDPNTTLNIVEQDDDAEARP